MRAAPTRRRAGAPPGSQPARRPPWERPARLPAGVRRAATPRADRWSPARLVDSVSSRPPTADVARGAPVLQESPEARRKWEARPDPLRRASATTAGDSLRERQARRGRATPLWKVSDEPDLRRDVIPQSLTRALPP